MTGHAPKKRTARALIVDDSAVARKVLASILQREGLDTRVAASAEAALDMLRDDQPDVVFLDHNMPGMDGFEALKALKSNPRTAAIPVMMFTTRSGIDYLRQARALGAVDVLSKDSLAEIDLSGRLEQLGIFDPRPAEPSPVSSAARQTPSPATTPNPRQTATLMRLLIREEFGKLRSELPTLMEQACTQHNGASGTSPSPMKPADSARKTHWLPTMLAASAVLGIGWLLYSSMPQRPSQTPRQPVAVASVNLHKNTASHTPAHNARLLDVVSWAINQQLRYPLQEQALADKRLERIRTLTTLLGEAGFKGTVHLRIHQGRFCTVTDSTGRKRLPPPDTPLSACNIARPVADALGAGQMSLPFAMFMENSPFANGERGIRVSVQPVGDRDPMMLYPDENSGVTAGEWNRIAAANNRVELVLNESSGERD